MAYMNKSTAMSPMPPMTMMKQTMPSKSGVDKMAVAKMCKENKCPVPNMKNC